ncbi:hypothetical protein D3C78_1045320 [compost metagenome]
MEQLLAAKQGCDTGALGHFQLAQGGTDAPFLGTQAINEQFPLAGDMHFQRGPGDGRGFWRNRHFQQLGDPRQACTLHQQRYQYDKEREVEVQLGIRQAGHQREHRENDRDRAT